MTYDIDKMADDVWENGFAIFHGLMTPDDVDGIFSQMNQVFDVALEHCGAPEMKTKHIDEKYTFLEKNHPALKSHCYDVLSQLDSVRTFVSKPEIFALAHKLYDSPIAVDLIQVRVNAPDNRYVQPWHQELGQMSELNMTVWTPLVDIDEEIGGLFVVPQSHKRGLVKHYYMDHSGMKTKVHAIREEEMEGDEPFRVIMKAGDALAFHPHLFHVTADNNSDRTRWTIVTRYNELSKMHYLHSGDADKHVDETLGTR